MANQSPMPSTTSAKALSTALITAVVPVLEPYIQSALGTSKPQVAYGVLMILGYLMTWAVPNKKVADPTPPKVAPEANDFPA